MNKEFIDLALKEMTHPTVLEPLSRYYLDNVYAQGHKDVVLHMESTSFKFEDRETFLRQNPTLPDRFKAKLSQPAVADNGDLAVWVVASIGGAKAISTLRITPVTP